MQINYNKQSSATHKSGSRSSKQIKTKLLGSIILFIVVIMVSIRIWTNINYNALNNQEIKVTIINKNTQPTHPKIINKQSSVVKNSNPNPIANNSIPEPTTNNTEKIINNTKTENIDEQKSISPDNNLQNKKYDTFNSLKIDPKIIIDKVKSKNPYDILNDIKPVSKYYIQLASSTNIDKIINIQNKLANSNIRSSIVNDNLSKQVIHKLLTGPYYSMEQASHKLTYIKNSLEN